MESGDGLIVRLSARGARLTASELRALASAAGEHGNGLLEITRRGKLQLRGIRDSALAALQTELAARGLSDSSVLSVNPLAGLHPDCPPLDALARALETALAASGVRAKLSDKFGIVLDSGWVLRELEADIRVEVDAADPSSAAVSVASEPLAVGPTERSPAAIVALAQALASSAFERMRELVRAEGVQALRAQLDPTWSAPSRASSGSELPSHIGFHHASVDGQAWLGLGIAFGSGELPQWEAIASIAEHAGTGEIRITPFRSVILPGVVSDPAREIERRATGAGLILDPADPLLRAIACPGAPACASAHGPTRPLARQLARELLPLLATDARLHVSGCEKRCADRGRATVMLVHDPAGSKLELDLAAGV